MYKKYTEFNIIISNLDNLMAFWIDDKIKDVAESGKQLKRN
ncbi:hypothetical protein [Clostridium sp. BL-8]|nr:hypothetical protein [Clostridium sp. BL-8]